MSEKLLEERGWVKIHVLHWKHPAFGEVYKGVFRSKDTEWILERDERQHSLNVESLREALAKAEVFEIKPKKIKVVKIRKPRKVKNLVVNNNAIKIKKKRGRPKKNN